MTPCMKNQSYLNLEFFFPILRFKFKILARSLSRVLYLLISVSWYNEILLIRNISIWRRLYCLSFLSIWFKERKRKKQKRKVRGENTRLKKFETICWQVGGVLRYKKHCSLNLLVYLIVLNKELSCCHRLKFSDPYI